MKPIIGIILDHEPPGGYSKFPWYALRESYFSCFNQTGAVCIGIPHDDTKIPEYLSLIDGLIITGGFFDIPPHLYGESATCDSMKHKDQRTIFEMTLARQALDRDMPVLGICGGHQLLNVLFGGTLIQHIPDAIENALNHEQPTPRDQPYHKITIHPQTRLHSIVGVSEMMVNSAHHQAIKIVGKGLVVNAVADDGVIEGVESLDHKYCVGLQWHPELLTSPKDPLIFQHFTQICSR